jgi:hypothetical protein
MASEIRVNSITNRSGLGTVTFSDTGVVLSGVSTFTVSSGSASAPSISPSGDSNTGIFFPSPDTIAFAEGGVEALRIDSSANIGIGTANPSQKLEVVGGEIKAGRVDSANEGGQVSFGRATDNATAWYIDVFGNTSTPQLRFVDVSNAAVRSSIDSSGNLTLNSGNLVIGTAGKGIDFSATSQAGGMTSELLADYEEGTWTPVLTFGGGSTGLTYNVASGNYTKVGNRVHASCVIFLSNRGSSVGNNSISGLPYVVRQVGGGTNFISVAAQYGDRMTPFHCFASNDATSLTITSRSTGPASTVVSLTNSDWSNTTYIGLHFSYRTD